MRLRSRWHRRPASLSLCVEHLEDRQLLSRAVRLLPPLLVDPVREPAAPTAAPVRSEPVERQAPASQDQPAPAPAPAPTDPAESAPQDGRTELTRTPTGTEPAPTA